MPKAVKANRAGRNPSESPKAIKALVSFLMAKLSLLGASFFSVVSPALISGMELLCNMAEFLEYILNINHSSSFDEYL